MADWFSEPRSNKSGIRRTMLAAGVFVMTGVCAIAAAPDSGRVTAVRFWSLGDVTRIAIEVSSDFTFKYNHLSDPERMFFDIHGARPDLTSGTRNGAHTIAVGDALLGQIRVAETQPAVTRVVLDLAQTASVTTSQLSNPNRLMIELRSKDRPAPPGGPSVTGGKELTVSGDKGSVQVQAVWAKAAPTPVVSKPDVSKPDVSRLDVVSRPDVLAKADIESKPEPRKFIPPPVQLRREPKPTLVVAEVEAPARIAVLSKPARLPSFTSVLPRELPPPAESVSAPSPAVPSSVRLSTPAKRGDQSLIRALGLKLERVVIDAGHGGNDVGTHGPSGYYEKDLTLDVAQRLGALISDRMGSEVVYTRSDDTYVGLEERTRIANQRQADLFLSIHANSSPYRAAAGVETYVLNFTTSKTALQLAARENATSDRSIHELHNLLEKIALKDKIDESREFAAKLQTSLSVVSKSGTQGAKNRGIKSAPFVVLIGAEMPSVLAEIGFLTNSSEEVLLRKPEYRQKIAEALYKGISAYADTLSRVAVARRN
jgi:N-acetylmuramoyl-L-alanine amidase